MIYGYFGIIGSGKTLGAVIHAYKQYLKGETIYSLMPLNFEHVPIRNYTDFLECKHGLLLADELWFILDSRFSSSKRNNILSTILLRARKQQLDIVYTEQHITQIDVRIRRNTHFFIQSSIDPYFSKINNAKIFLRHGGHFTLEQYIHDINGILVDKRYIAQVERYFPLYNTDDDPYLFDMKKMKEKIEKMKEQLVSM